MLKSRTSVLDSARTRIYVRRLSVFEFFLLVRIMALYKSERLGYLMIKSATGQKGSKPRKSACCVLMGGKYLLQLEIKSAAICTMNS